MASLTDLLAPVLHLLGLGGANPQAAAQPTATGTAPAAPGTPAAPAFDANAMVQYAMASDPQMAGYMDALKKGGTAPADYLQKVHGHQRNMELLGAGLGGLAGLLQGGPRNQFGQRSWASALGAGLEGGLSGAENFGFGKPSASTMDPLKVASEAQALSDQQKAAQQFGFASPELAKLSISQKSVKDLAAQADGWAAAEADPARKAQYQRLAQYAKIAPNMEVFKSYIDADKGIGEEALNKAKIAELNAVAAHVGQPTAGLAVDDQGNVMAAIPGAKLPPTAHKFGEAAKYVNWIKRDDKGKVISELPLPAGETPEDRGLSGYESESAIKATKPPGGGAEKMTHWVQYDDKGKPINETLLPATAPKPAGPGWKSLEVKKEERLTAAEKSTEDARAAAEKDKAAARAEHIREFNLSQDKWKPGAGGLVRNLPDGTIISVPVDKGGFMNWLNSATGTTPPAQVVGADGTVTKMTPDQLQNWLGPVESVLRQLPTQVPGARVDRINPDGSVHFIAPDGTGHTASP